MPNPFRVLGFRNARRKRRSVPGRLEGGLLAIGFDGHLALGFVLAVCVEERLDVLGQREEAREAALFEVPALGFIGETAGGFGDLAGDLGFHFGDDGVDVGLGHSVVG